MLADTVLGIALLMVIGGLLSATILQHGNARERLAGSRAALRAADRVLGDLQMGQTPPPSGETTQWQVTPLESPAPRGQVWVEVRVVHRGRPATLTGVVPASSVKGASP